MVVGVALTGSVVPANATDYSSITSDSWAYVDSAAPRTSFANQDGDAPVGAQVFASGTVHVFRSYVNFNLSSLRGARLVSASLITNETTVNDCTTQFSTQAWLTETSRKPTWAHQPAEQSPLPSLNGTFPRCPAPSLAWDATEALGKALQDGRSSVTFELRLPEDQQSDQRFSRTYNPKATLVVQANRPPGKPTGLTVNSTDCGQHQAVAAGTIRLSAVVSDPDDAFSLTAEFVYWPKQHPDQRTTLVASGVSGSRTVASIWYQDLTDGTDYAWQVHAKDTLDTGPWSAVCTFSTDFTAPDKAPTVSSADYPTPAFPGTGGTGVPGQFTFNANGVRDVVGFYYGEFEARTFVPADHRGGSATIRYTPSSPGPDNLVVRSADAADNRSESTRYDFWVVNNEPPTSCTPASGYLGVPRDCVFSSPSPVAGYVYSVNRGPGTEVPAGPDGTAHVTIVPTQPELSQSIEVRARLGNGNLTAAGFYHLDVDLGTPTAAVLTANPTIGQPVQVKLGSVLPGSVTFTYTWSDDQPVTIPVGPDGTATITLIPTQPYGQLLSVHTTTGDGLQSGTLDDYIDAQAGTPSAGH
ncbi:DNRLRE domain-containing protein [Actinocrispum wychmicini]|nr:DNRLRE domain-containing protein [Actinocrispum wychmicini]